MIASTFGFWIGGSIPTPTNLAAGTATSSTVPLTWTNNAGVSANTQVEWSTNQTTWTTALSGVGTSSYTVSGLSANSVYYFRIKAVVGGVGGLYTASVVKTTSAPPNYNITSFTVTYKGRLQGSPPYHVFEYLFQGDWVNYYMVSSNSNGTSAFAGNAARVAGTMAWGQTGSIGFSISPPSGSTISGQTTTTCVVPATAAEIAFY